MEKITDHRFRHGCFASCQSNHDEWKCDQMSSDLTRCGRAKEEHQEVPFKTVGMQMEVISKLLKV